MVGRKKKSEPITGTGKDPENQLIVQKSRPLYALWRSGLTLAEFKILDTYLSRIDSHKPEKRTVIFEKGELEGLLGVKKINNAELEERLKHLMGNVVKVDDPTKTKSYRFVTLFEEAIAEQDEYGLWQVRLECTQKAMKYFFNVENLGYLRYKLRCVTSIESRYTYIMFVYLEANRFRKSWEISLDELKHILNCENEDFYREFKYFNRDILKRVQKEMHEKTECRYTYESIKKGRSVVAIRFTVETLPKLNLELEPEEGNEILEFLRSACSRDNEPEFSREEMQQIFEVLVTIPENKLPSKEALPVQSIEMQRYHYLREKYAAMERLANRKPIKHRFSYFIAIIKRDGH